MHISLQLHQRCRCWAQVLDEIIKLAAAFIGLQHSIEGSSFEAVSTLLPVPALRSGVHLASISIRYEYLRRAPRGRQ